MTAPNNMPAEWTTADTLEGLDILDKSQLVDVPFRITGCIFQNSNSGVNIVYIDAERADGYAFTFLDSSTGVRAQVVKYLTDKNLDAAVETGEYVELSLIAPNGLRVSEYLIEERGPGGQVVRGRTRNAKTYYLTTSGRRTARGQAKVTQTAKRTPAAK